MPTITTHNNTVTLKDVLEPTTPTHFNPTNITPIFPTSITPILIFSLAYTYMTTACTYSIYCLLLYMSLPSIHYSTTLYCIYFETLIVMLAIMQYQ
jgi:hypothetical protein